VSIERWEKRKKIAHKYDNIAPCFSMASPTESEASSGYSSQPGSAVKPHYACYWLDSCGGSHELDQCEYWNDELRGQLCLYYSPLGNPTYFDVEWHPKLKHNPTGCTKVHALIYTIRSQDQTEILFGLSHQHHELVFPSSKPRRRGEPHMEVARRALDWITGETAIIEKGLKSRFLFCDANIIYPVYLTNEQADRLTNTFIPSEQILSLHWFSLETVLGRLEERRNKEHEGKLGGHRLQPLIKTFLTRIRNDVPRGFETFLEL
jgi:hypothetical protein